MSGLSPWVSRRLGGIRLRILAVVVLLLVTSSIGSVLLLRTALVERLDDEVTESLEREADEFRLLSAGNNPETGEPFSGDLIAIFDTYFAREIADEGESLLGFIGGELYESRRAQDAADADDLQPAIDHWLSLDRPESDSIDTIQGRARYVAMPVRGREENGLFVVVNFPSFERGEIDDAIRVQIVVQLVTTAIVVVLGAFLASRVLRPLTSLARTASTISNTELSNRIRITGHDEASQIAVAFNEMLGRLEAAFAAQAQLVHDTSHELRTPLAVIRGHVELLELDTTVADRRATIALVVDEIDRMARLVDDLFLLAESEHPDFLQTKVVDLSEVAIDAHERVKELGDRDWQVQAPVSVMAIADRQRLTQAIMQLVSNALRFTTNGDVIRIGAEASDSHATVWVEDTGQGVSAADAERIFERFARGSQPTGSTSGMGRGLTIVMSIAQAHGGSVRLKPRLATGARFEIMFPRGLSSKDRHSRSR